jgi:hypothetical protein
MPALTLINFCPPYPFTQRLWGTPNLAGDKDQCQPTQMGIHRGGQIIAGLPVPALSGNISFSCL